MPRHAIVTGGGTGVGRAVSLLLAQDGWRVLIVGRRHDPLLETASHAPPGQIETAVCDVADSADVDRLRDRVLAAWDGVDAIVSAAGINVTRRSLRDGSLDDFQKVMGVNLLGTVHLVRAFASAMAGRDRATVVAIVSDAALAASAKAGVAYTVSKFGLAGLVESINAEMRADGLRACAVFPGDVDTPLLDVRPVVPTAADRARMLRPDDVAECVKLALDLPHRAIVEKLVVRPR